jgi:hypothetical protein
MGRRSAGTTQHSDKPSSKSKASEETSTPKTRKNIQYIVNLRKMENDLKKK